MEDLGGYEALSKDEINGNLPLLNQPTWQIAFLQLHTKSILEYAVAPRDRRIDPTYCPVVKQYSWAQFDTISTILSHIIFHYSLLLIDFVQKSISFLAFAMLLIYIKGYLT